MSRLHVLLERYARDHENAPHPTIRLFGAPLVLWSLIAMVWTIPVPGTWFQPGAFAGALMAVLASWYVRGSRAIGLGAVLAFVISGALCWAIATAVGMRGLLLLAIAAFFGGCIGLLVGHRIDVKRHGLTAALVNLLVGPAWMLSTLYRRLGIAY
jgi:uncharacterized membrane protein YGL010W